MIYMNSIINHSLIPFHPLLLKLLTLPRRPPPPALATSLLPARATPTETTVAEQ